MHKPNAIDAAVDKALADWGIPFSARYMGEDDRDPDPERAIMDHWHVTVGKYRTDFYTGIGLRGPTPAPAAGRPAPRRGTLAHEQLERQRKPVKPTAAAVLHCLLADAEAVDMSFYDWAGNLGYNGDSIKDRATYDACCECGWAMRREFTRSQMDELRDLLQDY